MHIGGNYSTSPTSIHQSVSVSSLTDPGDYRDQYTVVLSNKGMLITAYTHFNTYSEKVYDIIILY